MTVSHPIPHQSHERARKTLGFIATAGFLVIYPVFFLYHFLIGKLGFPAFAMGLYGPVTMAIIPFAALSALLYSRLILNNNAGAFFAILIGYSIFWIAINGYANPDSHVSDEINNQYISTIIFWISLFFVGMHLSFSDKFFIKAATLLWIAIIISVITNVNLSYLIFSHKETSGADSASYQGMARSLLLVSLYLAAVIQNRAILIFTISAPILFLVGARSEMVAFICVAAALIVLHARARPLLSIFVGCCAFALSVWLTFFAQSHGNSRQFGLYQLGADTSWNARQDMMQFAIQQIYENPIWGLYGGHFLYNYENLGSGAHNILSAWVAFGVVGIVLYSALIFGSLVFFSNLAVRNSSNPKVIFYFMLSVAFAVMSVFSKGVFWGEPALVWGGVLSASIAQRVHAPRPHHAWMH